MKADRLATVYEKNELPTNVIPYSHKVAYESLLKLRKRKARLFHIRLAFILICFTTATLYVKLYCASSFKAMFKPAVASKVLFPLTKRKATGYNETRTAKLSKNQDYIEKKLKIALNKAQKEQYYILVWKPPFGNPLRDNEINSSLCGNCEVVYSKEVLNIKSVKAVLFHFDEVYAEVIPTNRRPDQLFVWWSSESPPSIRDVRGMYLNDLNYHFNLTMSYRRDSDIYAPYGFSYSVLEKINDGVHSNQDDAIDALLSSKTHLAIWIVTNCYDSESSSMRWWLINRLVDSGLKLDRFGKCFPDFQYFVTKKIIRNYKFYIAFENSWHCTDYITEKVFENAFLYDAVPIVWGSSKSDYEALLPPNSFIFAEDFENFKKLVQYINYLDKNDTAYKEYFQWRKMLPKDMPMYGRVGGLCQLCRVVHGINVDNIYRRNYQELARTVPLFGYPKKPRIVQSIPKWFFNESKDCLPNKFEPFRSPMVWEEQKPLEYRKR